MDSHMNYQLACSVGILDKYMTRNAFQIVQNTVDFQISREKMISPREAVRLLSICNGQGLIMCECNGQCKTKPCKFFKLFLKCKSRIQLLFSKKKIFKHWVTSKLVYFN
jgi:hypothetical protein